MNKLLISILIIMIFCVDTLFAQLHTNQNIFRQLVEELPTPNSFRLATGHPGPDYFQQQVDYDMDIVLDENTKSVSGEATVTYHNNSPEALNYLWLQLDQNIREPESFASKIETGEMAETMRMATLKQMNNNFDGGFKIDWIKDSFGNDLQTVKNHTIMKVILPEVLKSGATTTMTMKWHYKLNNIKELWGRSGFNQEENGSGEIFAIAQFYPRLCVFNDLGWQIKQFIGAEFALEFGNFKVKITVPADHVVAATGELKNEKEVLTSTQINRLDLAKDSDKPVFIITEEEATENEKSHLTEAKTWHFEAENVRDFAFASSRKFIWDAMSVKFPENNVLAMSFYPKEANPLWELYSTKSIAHTLKIYSDHTFGFPYPTANSVNVQGISGMEYPMICFNDGQPNPDKTYSANQKRGVIGVVHHEVGHNYFPMIVNVDEREWAWMDEGFNIFLQGIAEHDWDPDWEWSGRPVEMIGYMDDDKSTLTPIMTAADALLQSAMTSYRKPAVGLTILRETILGRELFDLAFREYAETWKFKRPQPADFFRCMENASGVDLNWFWRGWFFTTEHVDLAIENVVVFEPRSGQINELRPNFSKNELALLESGQKYYEITFKALGGMIMPLIIQFEFKDGSKEIRRIPAEIWLLNQKEVSKVFNFTKEVKSITLDPFLETADINTKNNFWPEINEHIYFKVQK